VRKGLGGVCDAVLRRRNGTNRPICRRYVFPTNGVIQDNSSKIHREFIPDSSPCAILVARNIGQPSTAWTSGSLRQRTRERPAAVSRFFDGDTREKVASRNDSATKTPPKGDSQHVQGWARGEPEHPDQPEHSLYRLEGEGLDKEELQETMSKRNGSRSSTKARSTSIYPEQEQEGAYTPPN
jgi:hypothetical protein